MKITQCIYCNNNLIYENFNLDEDALCWHAKDDDCQYIVYYYKKDLDKTNYIIYMKKYKILYNSTQNYIKFGNNSDFHLENLIIDLNKNQLNVLNYNELINKIKIYFSFK